MGGYTLAYPPRCTLSTKRWWASRSQIQPHTPPTKPNPTHLIPLLLLSLLSCSFPHSPPPPPPTTSTIFLSFTTLLILHHLSYPSPPSTPMASSSSPTDPSPPFALPLLPPPPSSSTTTSRRLPPPCWSPEETAALITSYRDKWYSLARSNLKATHWQEVADAVSAACPNVSPSKTAVQCRHKMEKLRKRYRAEIQRARNLPVKKFNSSWLHFKLMDSMEKGPSPPKPDNNNNNDNADFVDVDDEIDAEDEEDQDFIHANSLYKLRRNGIGSSGGGDGGIGGGGGGGSRRVEGGFRIRIPSGVSVAKPDSRFYGRFNDEKRNPNSSYGGKSVKEGSALGKRERDPVEEMVNAIKVLGDGFVRTEQLKMEMAREIESMRMDMEMKRTEMILESQHRIVEAFANAVSEKNKKTKRVPSSPES
ncbi:hypothetical protein Lal_00008283 [Lupinus albus]|uniref:Putative transcription factor MYB family n=1 Tax=Lupinus albus TaxID=3870 RepID=A0A6A5M3V5_LUPAL|nr:putative transcription factor MYB family [Lupinus albus]KAF1868476.1 hypothetical protein Lal_00008283 [Lupinus albus]